MSGYHEFYRATLIHKGIPLQAVSLWNTVILGIQTIMQHQYGPDFFNHCTKDFFSPTVYIVLFCAFETIILCAVHGTYIRRVSRFNKATLPPDAFRGLSPSISSVSPKMQSNERRRNAMSFGIISDWCGNARVGNGRSTRETG